MNSWLQKLPPLSFFAENCLSIEAGQEIAQNDISDFLSRKTYAYPDGKGIWRISLRGGILDIFASTLAPPVRLDFFGDEIESIRVFDPLSQRSEGDVGKLTIHPASEYCLDEAVISQFRQRYLALFGGKSARDPLYEAVSAGQTPPGIEHWLSLLHDKLVPLSGCFSDWPCLFDVDCLPAATARAEQISDFYTARCEAMSDKDETAYRPVPPDALYLAAEDISGLNELKNASFLYNFAASDGADMPDTMARLARIFIKQPEQMPGHCCSPVI